ncbi:S1 family peptidase [Nocardia alni]|uniref:S1 family peptidase n=1 Tax=Nocardia alni TaxID=2815723 RepID=UPI001C235BD6|nr:S1 family peptidase [Nocardia alni]
MKTMRPVCRTAMVAVSALLLSTPIVASAAPPEPGLPADLVAAIGRDLHISPQEYERRVDDAQRLADFAGAQRRQAPGSVTDIRLDRTGRAVVALAPGAGGVQAAARRAGFVVAEHPVPQAAEHWGLPAPHVVPVSDPAPATPSADADTTSVAGGDPYISLLPPPSTQGAACSWAFNAVDPQGHPAAITAGHCNVAVLDGHPVSVDQHTAQSLPGRKIGAQNGVFEKSVIDGVRDYSIVRIANPMRDAFRNNLVRGHIDGPPIAVTGVGIPVAGEPVCKSGATTGFTCGVITSVDQPDPNRPPIRFKHTALALPGDSGGALISGTLAMGIVSEGSINTDTKDFPTDPPGLLPPAPPGAPNVGRILQLIGPRTLERLSPPIDAVLPYIPQVSMIAQSIGDVLAQNPGLWIRTK